MENDLISREKVLKIIEDIKCNRDVPKNYGTLLDIMRLIRNLPTEYDLSKSDSSGCAEELIKELIKLNIAVEVDGLSDSRQNIIKLLQKDSLTADEKSMFLFYTNTFLSCS